MVKWFFITGFLIYGITYASFLVSRIPQFIGDYEFITSEGTFQRQIEEGFTDSTSKYSNWDKNPKKMIEISINSEKAAKKRSDGEYYIIKYRADLNFSKQLIKNGVLKEIKVISSDLFNKYPNNKLEGLKIISYLPCDTNYGFKIMTRFIKVELTRKFTQEINWRKIRPQDLKKLLQQDDKYKLYSEKDKDYFFFKPSCISNSD